MITLDQLKVGGGVEEHLNLLKDNVVVGTLHVRSVFEKEPEPEDVFDVIDFIKEKPAPVVINEPIIDHQLFPSRSYQSLNPMIVPLDPLADMEQSIIAAQESQSVMQSSIMKSVIAPKEYKSSMNDDSQTQSMMFQQLYGIQQPVWVNQDPNKRPVTPEQSASRKASKMLRERNELART